MNDRLLKKVLEFEDSLDIFSFPILDNRLSMWSSYSSGITIERDDSDIGISQYIEYDIRDLGDLRERRKISIPLEMMIRKPFFRDKNGKPFQLLGSVRLESSIVDFLYLKMSKIWLEKSNISLSSLLESGSEVFSIQEINVKKIFESFEDQNSFSNDIKTLGEILEEETELKKIEDYLDGKIFEFKFSPASSKDFSICLKSEDLIGEMTTRNLKPLQTFLTSGNIKFANKRDMIHNNLIQGIFWRNGIFNYHKDFLYPDDEIELNIAMGVE